MEKYDRALQAIDDHGTWGLHAAYLRLQIHTQNMRHLLLSHCHNGCTNAPHCYVTRALSGLFWQSSFTVHQISQNHPSQSSAAIVWLYLSGLWHTGLLPSTIDDSYTMHHSVLNNHTNMPPFLAAIFSPVTSSASAFSLLHIKYNLITPNVVNMSTHFQQAWTIAHSSTHCNWHDGFAVNQWHKQNPRWAKRCSWLHKLTSYACYATMSWHISDQFQHSPCVQYLGEREYWYSDITATRKVGTTVKMSWKFRKKKKKSDHYKPFLKIQPPKKLDIHLCSQVCMPKTTTVWCTRR